MVAESVLVKHQLLILNRGLKRAPNLRVADRIIAGLCTFFLRPARSPLRHRSEVQALVFALQTQRAGTQRGLAGARAGDF